MLLHMGCSWSLLIKVGCWLPCLATSVTRPLAASMHALGICRAGPFELLIDGGIRAFKAVRPQLVHLSSAG
jgi:hypothetical protein